MTIVRARQCISLDGFTAAPDQSLDNPFGTGGMALNDWMFTDEGQPIAHRAQPMEEVGAHIMGRHMFGPGRGEWDLSWRGWWGEEPPYHAPVYVLTHHAREPLELEGTTFHFVTDGPESALAHAKAAAGSKDVAIAGGANVVRQYLALGAIDELVLHYVPLTLGAGERLLDGLGGLTFVPTEVVPTAAATHVWYRPNR
ncbi:dihydrofolate reductase family protein [Tenggerimyces flavus]|uniref:Dihydrofolate reductase family protein n=1 Tax=Tenggerimyces flavus TaxID=1708749 RepID=A0ABV7Y6W9_9ACTN|nr:dihydrofolate reductase family protein [Tenggerimyces flavus]MBM7785469.1 dihydrofolate reductase [Tenggerimyces flavus]